MRKRATVDNKTPRTSRFLKGICDSAHCLYFDGIVTVRDAQTGEVKRHETPAGETITEQGKYYG